MRKIYKYPIPLSATPTELTLPEDSNIRLVALQDGVITLWIEVDPTKPETKRYFKIFGTGHTIDAGAQYIGTVFIDIFVWHIHEVQIADKVSEEFTGTGTCQRIIAWEAPDAPTRCGKLCRGTLCEEHVNEPLS